MTMPRFYFRFSLAMVSLTVGLIAVARAITGFLVSAFALLKSADPVFDRGWSVDYFAKLAEPIDPALLNSLRHEAGMPRLSSARNV